MMNGSSGKVAAVVAAVDAAKWKDGNGGASNKCCQGCDDRKY